MRKEEKIALIRKSIQENRYPLQYQYLSYYKSSNCYSYAIGSKYVESESDDEYIYNLGCMSGLYPARNRLEAEKAFISDMDVIGINVRKSSFEEQLHEQEWKIAFFYDDYCVYFYDFHFARQNADGSWSHQEGIRRPIRCFEYSPEYCTDIELLGYYILKVNKSNNY